MTVTPATSGEGSLKEICDMKNLFLLNGRAIIGECVSVTGATGGLGRELSKAILEVGGDVIAVDCANEEPDDSAWGELKSTGEKHGSSLSYYSCDITDPEQTETVFEKATTSARFPLRGLVNSAGISVLGESISFPLETARRIIDVNLVGSLIVAQMAARIVQRQKFSASFVFIASMSGYVVNKGIGTAAYSASKAGVHQLTRNLAAEWGCHEGSHMIRVNSISPGVIKTPMSSAILREDGVETLWTQETMLKRLAVPEDFRGPITFLLSDASAYITATDLLVDGGYTSW
ncbi:hypothetical protein F5884DRAFT_891389 [Xylogone sp. PMI_703]|nr:hypothetical protein F5884DRAFT_891389 [Xylogone sp. PMI_703]